MPFDSSTRFPRAPLDALPPATHGEPPSRAVLPPLDENAILDELRRQEAEALTRVPHVRQVLRHPLGRNPDLWVNLDRDAEGREYLSLINAPNLIGGAILVVLTWALIYYGGLAILEAMRNGAAEAAIRGPH